MVERSSAGGALIGVFREAVRLFHGGTPPSPAENLAVQAFEDIVDAAYSTAVQADQQIVMFAGHGPEHHLRLGKFALNLMREWKESIPDGSPIRDIRCLLLIYSSFVLHDIGMGVRNNSSHPADRNLRYDQQQRRGHDLRSLQYIEATLIRPLHSGGSSSTSRWTAFWQDQKNEDWPERAPYLAAILLARICQTHGDPSSIWLTDTSICSYIFATAEGEPRGEVSLSAYWGELWADEIGPMTMTASTVLCLCDLADMGKGRFVRPPDEWEQDERPADTAAARQSWLHWAAHQLVKPQVDDRRIVVRVAKAGSPLAMLALPIVAGPVPPLLQWGRRPQFVRNVRTYLNTRFDIVDVIPGVARDETWEMVERKLVSAENMYLWRRERLNVQEQNDRPEAALVDFVLKPHWWDAAFERGPTEFWSGRLGVLNPTQIAISARDEGIAYEDYLRPAAGLAPSAALVARAPATGLSGEQYCDGFFAALRVARTLLLEHPDRYWRVVFCAKGITPYEALSARESVTDEYRGNVFICAMTTETDLDQYKNIAQASSLERDITTVFFGDPGCADAMEQFGVASIAFDLNISTPYPVIAQAIAPRQPQSIYEHLITAAPSSAFLEGRIYNHIDRGNTPESKSALGLFVLIICLDALDWAGTGLVSREDLRRIYSAVEGSLNPYALCDLNQALSILVGRPEVLQVDGDVLKALGGFPDLVLAREILQARSRKLTLLAVLTISLLDNQGILRSLRQSFRSVWALPQATLSVARDAIADAENTSAQRASLALWLGDCIGWEVAQGLRNVRAASGEIVSIVRSCPVGSPFVLRQQVAYRFAVQALAHLPEIQSELSNYSPEFLLGLLEGVGSSEVADRSLDGIVANIFEVLIDRVGSSPDSEVHVAIAYDILYKYGSENIVLEQMGERLKIFGASRGWDLVAAYFHGGGEVGQDRLQSSTVQGWKVFRQELLTLLSESTPVDLRRRASSSTVLERAMEA